MKQKGEPLNNVFQSIDIVFSGICEGCKYADLELDSAEQYLGEKYWIVKCKHERACTEARRKALSEVERRTNEK